MSFKPIDHASASSHKKTTTAAQDVAKKPSEKKTRPPKPSTELQRREGSASGAGKDKTGSHAAPSGRKVFLGNR